MYKHKKVFNLSPMDDAPKDRFILLTDGYNVAYGGWIKVLPDEDKITWGYRGTCKELTFDPTTWQDIGGDGSFVNILPARLNECDDPKGEIDIGDALAHSFEDKQLKGKL